MKRLVMVLVVAFGLAGLVAAASAYMGNGGYAGPHGYGLGYEWSGGMGPGAMHSGMGLGWMGSGMGPGAMHSGMGQGFMSNGWRTSGMGGMSYGGYGSDRQGTRPYTRPGAVWTRPGPTGR